MRRAVAAAAALLAALPACKPRNLPVVYDLAARLPVAERWSTRDVVLAGTAAAEPHLSDGFYREGTGTERFVWARESAEIAFVWPEVAARTALVELAPFSGVRAQAAEVLLNGTPLGRFSLNERRDRYRLSLPAEAQRPGDNRLRLTFAAAAAPSDGDPKNPDRRRLAAALYAITVARADDAGLDDLLARGAPSAFEATSEGGVPAVGQVGPSVLRYALRVPKDGTFRFTPALHPAARTAAGAVSMRVTVETAEGEREAWSRVLRASDEPPGEQDVALGGDEGEVVRLGLHVGGAGTLRHAWAVWHAPRVLGHGGGDALVPATVPAETASRVEALRRSLQGVNVVLIVLDAARARSFGAYGYARDTTPHIDRIAREGTVFLNAITPAVYTLGAMSSVWTSQYPDRHHSEVSFSARLPKDRLTLAEVLSGQQVQTAGFVANAVAGRAFGFERGFLHFDEVFARLGSGAGSFRQAVPPWVRAHRDRRFFLYVHYREPHLPYDPPPPFDTKWGPDGPIPREARGDSPWLKDVNQGRRRLTPEEVDHLVRLYDGNLAYADQEVGELRRLLEAEGLWEKSVVIVTADHGEALYEHGWIGHNVQLHDASVHVPLIVRLPGGAAGGQRLAGLTDHLDLAPTIADVFGVLGQGGSAREFQGRSLLPALVGAPGKPAALSRTVWDRPRYALRDERYAYHYDTRTGEEALFDLSTDRGETKDLARSERLRAAYYRQALHHWIGTLTQARGSGPADQAEVSKEQCENLKSLGYVQTCP